jgi:hypothetical protein
VGQVGVMPRLQELHAVDITIMHTLLCLVLGLVKPLLAEGSAIYWLTIHPQHMVLQYGN